MSHSSGRKLRFAGSIAAMTVILLFGTAAGAWAGAPVASTSSPTGHVLLGMPLDTAAWLLAGLLLLLGMLGVSRSHERRLVAAGPAVDVELSLGGLLAANDGAHVEQPAPMPQVAR